MIRAVLDTNVVISIAIEGGRLQSLAAAWREARFRWLISQEIFDEYLRVLTYPRFELSSEDIQRIVELEIRPYAELIHVTTHVRAIPEDPSDDKFLDCAVDGRADWIVSGDQHLLRLKTFRGIRIGSPREFLHLIRKP